MERKCIHRFDAADENGRVYQIGVWEFSTLAATLGNSTGEARKLMLFTDDLQRVVQLRKGEYRIEDSGVLLKSSDSFSSNP